MKRRSPVTRMVLVGVRIAWGARLLLSPDGMLAKCPGLMPGYVRGAVRVLGARQVIEGVLLTGHARRPPPEWSIAVDGLHGLSMLALAAVRPGLRPAALRSAASAMALAGLSTYER